MICQTKPEIAADIQHLTDALAALSIGAAADYAALSAVIGRDVRSGGRYVLTAAMRAAEARTGALFEIVRNVGVKRLPTSEVHGVGQAILGKVRRTARRGLRRLEGVRANDLPEADAKRLIAYRSQLGAVALVADARKADTLTASAADSVLPAGRVLELFK